MKYVAFLRGINVGGKSLVKMADLKIIFEKLNYENVRTHINSGNVLFDTDEKNKSKIEDTLEKAIAKKYIFAPRVIVVSQKELVSVLVKIPNDWKRNNDLRMYIGFILRPKTTKEAVDVIKLKEGVDSIKEGPGVVYMSTKLSGLTKSGFTKMVGTPIYKYMTIRNLNTVKKLVGLLER